MNALTKAASGGALANNFANPFAAAGAGAGSSVYIKFKGASGDFLAGQDEEEIERGTQFAADIENSRWSWAFWWEGEVLETKETMIVEDPMGFENEPDYLPEGYDGDMSLEEIREAQADRKTNFMDGWGCQAVLGLREIGGEGTEYTLKLNQGVALNAFRTLLKSFGQQFRFKVGLVPIVELDARSYQSKNKTVGKRYSPILKIVDWKSEEDLLASAGEDPDMYDEDDERPAREDRKALAAPPAEAEEEAPRPRGRRGARFG